MLTRKPSQDRRRATRQGSTLLEVLLAAAILMAGLGAFAAMFPAMLNAGRAAEMLTQATALAQLKAEEIRRDDSSVMTVSGGVAGALVSAIQLSTTAATTPVVFPQEPRLEYSFSGRTYLYRSIWDADNATTDTRAMNGVARVIIRYAPSYKATEDVVYELRFD